MAMRQGGGGSRRGTRSVVVYEDFKPVSEWQQDDESHVLNIYLPGFAKEQIRVTTQGRNTIRVRGERLVAGNKWSRFLEDFQIPENGVMNSVRAKFHGGILSITVPKEAVGSTIPAETRGDDIRKQPQPTPQKGRVKAIPEEKAKNGNQKQPIPTHTGRDKPFPEVGTSQPTEDKILEPVKASAEPNKEHDLDDDLRGRNSTPLTTNRNQVSEDTEKEESSENHRGRSFTPTRSTKNAFPKNAENKESDETRAKHVASKKPKDVTKGKVHKEGKDTMGGSELPEAETTKTKESEKSRATYIPEMIADNKDSYVASKQQNFNKAAKGLTELNEERQLLVNMGVAMLVIMALTAYVTHSFATVERKN